MRWLALVALAVTAPIGRLAIDVARDVPGLFNDYHHYWLAGRLVAAGGDPYDRGALLDLARREGLVFLIGSGYSYPPPFALLMVPLSALPFYVSAAVFSVVSLIVFGGSVAVLVRPLRGRAILALAAGAYAPVAGSLFVGQANLLVFGLLAIGLAQGGSSFTAGLGFGAAALIKLVPVSLVAPLLLARRWRALLCIVMTIALSLCLAAMIAPQTFAGTTGMLALVQPDPYWTNQSFNGVITRAVGHDAGAFVAFATILFTGVTLATLWRHRAVLVDRQPLILAEAFVLIAATIAAPKNSFWNHTPALLGAWAIVSYDRPLTRTSRWLLGIWFVAAYYQPREEVAGVPGILMASGFIGVLALWVALALALLRTRDQLEATPANTR